MAALYKNAASFIQPSFEEGFGLPLLEALSLGCPVISSSRASLPEIAKDAAQYFDPTDIFDMSEKIKKVLEDKKLRDRMIKEGLEQVKKFSWEKSAREVLKVLESAVK